MSPLEEVRNAHLQSPTGAHDHASDLASDREVLLDIIAHVEALHAPVTVCQECAHPTASSCFTTGASHDPVVVCAVCCTVEGRQLSICLMTHDHTPDSADRCSTIRAINATPSEGAPRE